MMQSGSSLRSTAFPTFFPCVVVQSQELTVQNQNPAPRLSILQALAKPASFLDQPADDVEDAGGNEDEEDEDLTPRRTKRTPKGTTTLPEPTSPTTRKRKAPDSPVANGSHEGRPAPADLGQRFKEIETLHALWCSAGKSVNLWDWLEGFRAAVSDDKEAQENGVANGHAEGEGSSRAANAEDKDAEEQAQHATFIRFIEECRMLGLVRARGSRTSRRTDEVVKGVLMI